MKNNIILAGILVLIYQCFFTMHGAEIFEQFVWIIALCTMFDVDKAIGRTPLRLFANGAFATAVIIMLNSFIVIPQVGDKNIHHMVIITMICWLMTYIKLSLNKMTLATLYPPKRGNT